MNRQAESARVDAFLDSAARQPSALVIEGEPGIGKTTLWSVGLQRSAELGFRVLATRPAAAESALAYASLADLLGDVESAVLDDLPPPQRHAIDLVLLRADGEPTDRRTVAAGFLSVVRLLARRSPVLIAIDDLQWLDDSSAAVLGFAVRRFSDTVGVLCAVRTDSEGGGAPSWLQVRNGVPIERIALLPLSIGAVHAVVVERIGRSFSRRTMARIQEVSGGNPFYAVELARAFVDGMEVDGPLPATLSELVKARLAGLDDDVHHVLLAAACAGSPTVQLLAGATTADYAATVGLLELAEAKKIVEINGDSLRFTHPLLARGVYADASAARRRAMHRRLAQVVDDPESAARHLAMAATTGDCATLQSLDEAADMARLRGAPGAAAELVELAMGLGGDTPQRRIRSAGLHFEAGDPGRARSMLERTIATVGSGVVAAAALWLLGLVRLTDDNFLDAAGLLERGLGEAGGDLALRVQMLVSLCFARGNVGTLDAAADSADEAVADAERLGHPALLCQALGMQVMAHAVRGDGVDEQALARAMALEDPTVPVPLPFRASLQNAVLLAWIGRLERAHQEMLAVRHRCFERGEESELMFLAFHGTLIEVWRGELAAAAEIAEDAMERANLLGGDLPRFFAITSMAVVAAYAGRLEEARSNATTARELGQRGHSTTMLVWPDTVLGFVEVTRGDYAAAVMALGEQIARMGAAPNGTEVVAASFVPDAVEALIQLSRLTEAEPLIDRLERNGANLDRAWMLATGTRCRAMLLAAQGDLDGAGSAVRRAMVEHERLPMPFERARTQLLLGQIQRRTRRKDAAAATLREALTTLEGMGIPLWADKVRAELARCEMVPRRPAELTPAERRVAELAAQGLTNRDVAAALFISPKTVEVNLSRVYRKLGIRSRAELGGHMGQLGTSAG